MIEPLPSASPELVLGRQAEEEWRRLRRQMDLADGFWLGFLFCDASVVSTIFRQRIETLLQHRVQSVALLQPADGDALLDLLNPLLGNTFSGRGLVWLEGAVTRREDPAWRRGWESFLLRLNERRDLLRRTLDCGIVLAAGSWVKPLAREAAPDLWSVRSVVLEPRPAERRLPALAPRTRAPEPLEIEPVAAPAGEPLAQAVEERAQELLRRAEGLIATNRPEEAVAAAGDAVALLRRGAPRHLHLADALATLARAERESGDPAAAEDHIMAAIAQTPEQEVWKVVEWLEFAGDLAQEREDPSAAERSFGKALQLTRGAQSEEALPVRRRLVALLGRMGDIQISQGDLRRALSSYEESLAAARGLLSEYGESLELLRDLSLIFEWVGDVHYAQGDLSGALSAYDESLALARRLLSEYGESPDRLRDVSVSLEKVGKVEHAQGDLAGALESCEESLALAHRLLSEHGESPERLRDVSVIQERLGDVQLALGDFSGALSSYEETLGLRRRLLSEYGEAPDGLRNLSLSLDRVGDVQLSRGELSGALSSYEESLALTRRLLSKYGKSPERLRDLAASLSRFAGVAEARGELGRAVELLQEAVALLEQSARTYGETPPLRRDIDQLQSRLASLRAVASSS